MHTYSERSLGGFRLPNWRAARSSSFTLVEVVIAIAVTAFGLISILGLMAYASQVVKQADGYARLSTVARQMLATLGSQSFTLSQSEARTNDAFYFTSEGLPTNSTAAYYVCTIMNATPTGFALKDPNSDQLMEPVQVSIRWPKPAYTSTNIIVTSILQYD